MLQRLPGADQWGVEPDILMVFSAAEAWQVGQMRTAAEFPRFHQDGSPMKPPSAGHREGLPVLSADPAVVRAAMALSGS
jgi:hypothetical protein